MTDKPGRIAPSCFFRRVVTSHQWLRHFQEKTRAPGPQTGSLTSRRVSLASRHIRWGVQSQPLSLAIALLIRAQKLPSMKMNRACEKIRNLLLFGVVNSTASGGKVGSQSHDTLRCIYISNLRWPAWLSHRWKRCSDLSKATRVNISSISVPSEIKVSLLRALRAKTENHVNLLVTHSILLTYTRHVIYLLYNYFYFYRYMQGSGLARIFYSWLLLVDALWKEDCLSAGWL